MIYKPVRGAHTTLTLILKVGEFLTITIKSHYASE
jgi:hypothetical protein